MPSSTTMQIELRAVGGVENLAVAPCDPGQPGPGEILLRHQAMGVNFIDIYHRTGLYPLPLPAVLGVDGAGEVIALGPDVKDLAIGDRIAYAGLPGAYAEVRRLPAWRAIPLPPDLPLEAAAANFLRGLTAHMLLTRTYPVTANTTILIHAAAGGLGSILTRWAKDLGAVVIGTVGSDEKAALARGHGADHVIVGRDADFAAAVANLTEGRGVDFAIDGIGGTTLLKTFSCVRKFGTVASIGQAAGPIPPMSVDAIGPRLCLSLARHSVMAYAADPDTYRTAGPVVIDALSRGIIPNSLTRYALSAAAQAHQDLEQGRLSGSAVLIPHP